MILALWLFIAATDNIVPTQTVQPVGPMIMIGEISERVRREV